MKIYNKLVRDKIPEIIADSGKVFKKEILTDEAYKTALTEKAFEELQEYVEAEDQNGALEELADLLEVVHALAAVQKSSIAEIEKIRKEKAEKRGGFKEKIYLISVEDA